MLIVPLVPVPSQTVSVQLAGQNCKLNVYEKFYGLFMDVYVNDDDDPVIAGVICQNLNRIVRSAYLGFIGDFVFVDNQGSADPVYTGLGSQFVLAYLEAADLPAGVG